MGKFEFWILNIQVLIFNKSSDETLYMEIKSMALKSATLN